MVALTNHLLTTALDDSASQAEKAKAKIQYKIQSKYNSKVYKVK